jgi:ribonuclease R
MEEHYRALPLDDRLLFEVELKANGVNLAEAIDQLVHVEILRYPLGQYPPLGRVAQILGSDAEAASEFEIVRCKHDLPREFPEDVLAAAKKLPTKLRKLTLRDELICATCLQLRSMVPPRLLARRSMMP